jgi:cytochrome c oxidase subunit 3/cytochrome o ubiquinol oxidase subunit 3
MTVHAVEHEVHDTRHEGHPPTNTGVSNEKMAMWAFLGSECLLFGALISTYLLYRGHSVVGPYPKDVYDIPLATALLGATFIAGQIYEFTSFVHEGLTIHTNLFGSSFFVMTGFHGVHVTLGIVMLLTLWGMSMRGQLPPEKAETVEIAGLYWHFVDIVWIVIFTVVYLIK